MSRIQALLEARVAAGEIAGAVGVIARGEAVEIAAAGVQDLATRAPMRRETIFRIMSMTKPITAAAAMILVEDGRIALDEPVDRLLPELASRRVLRTPESALDDTVPAVRPIRIEDLLTLTLGIGWLRSGAVGDRMAALGLAPGPDPVPFAPDDYMARMGQLPLAAQPGARWLYHTGADILTVLVARAAGQSFPAFLRERVFTPLGMVDTGFSVPADGIGRLATGYARSPSGGLVVADPAAGGHYSASPVFPSELVSTADDYLRFARCLSRGGAPILSAASVTRMMTDQISQAVKAASPFFPGFWDAAGWGYGGAVVTQALEAGPGVGSYGWDGGFGTSVTIDRTADVITLLLLQRLMTGPNDSDIAADLRRIAYSG